MTILEFLDERLNEEDQIACDARILRGVAARRKIIELAYSDHYRTKAKSDPRAFDCNRWSEKQEKWVSSDDAYADCETLQVLASAYLDHPDFKEEWRP